MDAGSELELARHIDRVRRKQIVCRDAVVAREILGGWFSATRGGDAGALPSTSMDRGYWLTLESPLTAEHVASARETAREYSCARFYMWIAPWAWNPEVGSVLARAGAREWPDVAYLALTRPAGSFTAQRESPLAARRIEPSEAPAVLKAVSPWFGMLSIETASRLIARGVSELFAAFDGNTPVSVAFLTLDGRWAYLGAAGTSPDHRSRGGQTELIRARLRYAAERGVETCCCETHTAIPTSLRNLQRCGFQHAITWRVYVVA